MRLWRISHYADLTGVGGQKLPGRWHSNGNPIVYAAEHPAAALCELLVHVNYSNLPETFQLITIEADTGITAETVEPGSLPAGWIGEVRHTQSIGEGWLKRRSSPLLHVPSAILPDCMNVLINPSHPDASRIKIVNVTQVPLDARLRR